MGCSSSKDPNEISLKQIAENTPHLFRAHYRLGDELGEGAFSVVKLVFSKKTGEKYAAKCVTRIDLPRDDEESLLQEVDILKSLDHQNIVKYIDFFVEENSYYLILEYLEGGELFDRIVQKTCYTEKEARDVVILILNAIKYIHDLHIAHRDLKPENLLLTSKRDDASVKIADFGFAVKGASEKVLTTQCGTPGYVAPEILNNVPYDKSVDMWSIGVITYVLLGGYPPFHEENQKALFKKIRKGDFEFHPEYWNSVSEEAKDLIRSLLRVDSSTRLTCDQALQHPWIMKEAHELEKRDLGKSLEGLRKYQTNKKFRAAANAVIALNRIRRFSESICKQIDTDHAEESVEGLIVVGTSQHSKLSPQSIHPAPETESSTNSLGNDGLESRRLTESSKISPEEIHPPEKVS